MAHGINQEFEQLVSANRPLVLRTAHRLLRNPDDAQDAAQEVFLKLFRHRSGIGPHVTAWLYRVTVNLCKDRYKGMRAAELPQALKDPGPDPQRILISTERVRMIVEGIKLLPRRERMCLILRHMEGLQTSEVATRLNIDETTVRTQIHRARRQLARHVRDRSAGFFRDTRLGQA